MPNRFVPINPGTSLEQAMAVINSNFAQLDNESVTKSFRQAGGNNAVIIGKLPYDGGYGVLVYDTNGLSRVILGVAPDGTIGLYVSKPGDDLISAFS